MHCPRCGHRQNSDEISFCAKCGLDISDVRNLLASGTGETKAKRKKQQRKATRQGFLMILVGLALVMILGALREYFPVPKIIIVLPLLVFMFGGMIRMILPTLADESNSKEEKIDALLNNLETNNLASGQVSDKTLPEAQYQPPIGFGGKNYDTNELVQVPSITEETTKRLKKEFQQK